ncbi:MAG: PLDc N-terminal domain-containing protein [Planctomycetes bacterium]|nr:PLDc N-terminal domain-containing protein [Planctomycetota bacterium]MBI3846736.1 PLDc N-terminal domain-containing protein [Planctomycetota bacterium]
MGFLLDHLAAVIGFGLGVVLVAIVLKQRRPAASTLSWLLAIVLVPYLGVPLYLMLGGRKFKQRASKKAPLYPAVREEPLPPGGARDLERILRTAGTPAASDGNAVLLFDSGESAFNALAEMIAGAHRSIRIATFILGDDTAGNGILERLEAKARAGVEVRLLLDALFARRANRSRLASLERAGGKVAFFMPLVHIPFRGRSNLRNHRKIVLADGVRAMVGGMNIAEEYMGPTARAGRWRDLAMRVEGPAAGDLDAIFCSDWAFAAHETLVASTPVPAPVAHSGATVQVVASGPDVPEEPIYDAILSALFEARARVWIATPYFVPDETLARALLLAVRRGVDVRVLVPWPSNHFTADLAGGRYLRALERAGARIYLFRDAMMHAKTIVVDRDFGILGSVNFDLRSLFLDYEISLVVYSRPEVDRIARWFEDTFPKTGNRLPALSWARSLGEDVGRLLAPLL